MAEIVVQPELVDLELLVKVMQVEQEQLLVKVVLQVVAVEMLQKEESLLLLPLLKVKVVVIRKLLLLVELKKTLRRESDKQYMISAIVQEGKILI